MYKEILELKDYCEEIGVAVKLEKFLDGYLLSFNKGDVVQHRGSYGSKAGFVEFCYTGTDLDFCATTLEVSKEFVKTNKNYLNKEVI